MSGQLARLGRLRHPVLCVEPVQAMLDQAEVGGLGHITRVCEVELSTKPSQNFTVPRGGPYFCIKNVLKNCDKWA